MYIHRVWGLRGTSWLTWQMLHRVTVTDLLRRSERRALAAFRRAARQVPAYQQILREHRLPPEDVRCAEQFHAAVPVVNKHVIFGRFPLNSLSRHGDLRHLYALMVSSGTSGVFSFGIKGEAEFRRNAWGTDLALELFYAITRRKSFLLNCLSMGSRVYSGLPLADVGPHVQRALAVIWAVAKNFEQLFVVSLGHILMKLILEEGERQGVVWESVPLFILTGGEGLPENARSYFLTRWGGRCFAARAGGVQDPEERDPFASPRVVSSGGATELYLNAIFHETPETIRLRRLAHGDARLRRDLFGTESSATPQLFVWDPLISYLEILPVDDGPGEIVVTNLDPTAAVPLIRYNLLDRGKILLPSEVAQVLADHRLSRFTPTIPLPLLAFYGRWREELPAAYQRLDQELQEALYADAEVAGRLTGNFRIVVDPRGDSEAYFQLKPRLVATEAWQRRLQEAVDRYASVPLTAELRDFVGFPTGMGLSFENKFQYLSYAPEVQSLPEAPPAQTP